MGEIGDTELGRPGNKPATAYRTIGEVADELDLPAHVLRFWESKFPQLQPLKRDGGRRYYRPEDIVLVRRIRQCLYQEGYTIRGVQQLLNGAAKDDEDARSAVDPVAAPTLFPLDPVWEPAVGFDDAPRERPARRPHPRRPGSELRARLAEIRQELLEARALLDKLAGIGNRS